MELEIKPEQVRELTDGAGVDSVIIAGGNLENTWKEAIASAKAGGTVSNVNYLSGADNVLIPRVEWGCGMSGINITNGLCPGGAVRMERLADLALMGRQDPELLVTHKFEGLEKIEDALYLMKEKPNITAEECAIKINKSLRTTKELIKTLKSKNLIIRVGAKKNGFWEVK